MAGYTKEFLIDAYLHKFMHCDAVPIEQLERLEQLAVDFYDKVGRDKFRTYASLDAETIRVYKQQVK